MKILICAQVIDYNHPILGFFHNWIVEFSQRFKEVHVICLEQGACNLPAHVRVYSLGKENGSSKLRQLWRFYLLFGRILFTQKVDYVFYHMGAIYNVLAAPFYLVRFVTTSKFYWWKAHGHINWFGRLALRFVDRVYTSTESGFPIEHKKRRVIGQAIDTELFTLPKAEKTEVQVIYTGRITPIKQLETFINTATELESQYPFVVVGPVADEDYAKQLLTLSTGTSVTFIPPQTPTDLVSFYQRATIFLNTSLTHSLDKTVLEAVLCGCIPITANRAFRDWLEPEGLFVETPSAVAYATVMRRLLAEDTSDLQQRLRAHVMEEHSLKTFSGRIFDHD